jgi:hypothetical protein
MCIASPSDTIQSLLPRVRPAAATSPVSPLARPTPDQGDADAVAARVREKQQLDALAGYRSTFVSGPRGPGGPTLADQKAQLDFTAPLLTVDDAQRVAPNDKKPGTGGSGGGGTGDQGGTGPGDGGGGGGPGQTIKPFLVAPSAPNTGGAQVDSWWLPAGQQRRKVR